MMNAFLGLLIGLGSGVALAVVAALVVFALVMLGFWDTGAEASMIVFVLPVFVAVFVLKYICPVLGLIGLIVGVWRR